MKITFLVTISTVILVLSSCTENSKSDIAIFKKLDADLVVSNYNLEKNNTILYSSLNQRLTELRVANMANIWQPKALRIKEISDSLINYVDGLKKQLKLNSNFDSTREIYDLDNISAVKAIFKTNDRASELYEKFKRYNSDILNVDSTISNEFKNQVFDITSSYYDKELSKDDFIETYFTNTSTIAVLGLLNFYENQIRTSENKIISYCISKTV